MTRKFRLILYSIVLALPILSGIIYGNWKELVGFFVLVVVLAVTVEVVHYLQKKS